MALLAITRLGIGIADRERCLWRVRLLAQTIFRSLSQQTQPIRWIIVHDARMHPDAQDALRDIIGPYPTFSAAASDPLLYGMKATPPNVVAQMSAMACRVDDDDLVALNFAERMVAALHDKTAPYAVTFPDGYDVCPEQGVVVPRRMPWLAHSFATLSGDKLFSPYSVMHARIGERAVELGGGSEEIDGPPAWVYLRRMSSNGLESRPYQFRGETYTPGGMDELLAPFGIPDGWTCGYLELVADEPRNPQLVDVDGGNPPNRLAVKVALLSQIARETGDARKALVAAFYAV